MVSIITVEKYVMYREYKNQQLSECRIKDVNKIVKLYHLTSAGFRQIFDFLYKFSSNVCLGGFAGSEPSLSIACAGPDLTTRSRNSSAMAQFYPNV